MSEHGNLWRKIWNGAPALPASEQKPLLDPNQEGEKFIKLVCWSAVAAVGVLLQNFARLLLLQCCCEAGCY
ncbi:unnamed protein product [Camellia sinensis]